MIPEVTGLDLSEEGWQEKARAIRHAARHAMISRNSARDLARLLPRRGGGGASRSPIAASPPPSRRPPTAEIAAAPADAATCRRATR